MKKLSAIVLVAISCLSTSSYAGGGGTPAEPSARRCAPADLDARTLERIADELGKVKDQVSPGTRIGEHLSGPFSPVVLIDALEEEFNISLTEEEEERILDGTIRTAQEIVRAKHRKNVPANSCHLEESYDFDF